MRKWTIDPDHSVAAFSVKHMMIANVRGQFNKVTGVVYFDPSDIEHSLVEAEIDAAGIYTGIQKRDEHLRSADFFDVEKYPKIIFRSARIEGASGKRWQVIGNLTIKGITHPATLDAEYFGPVKGTEESETSIGFSATTNINQEDYDMTWNAALAEGGIVVGKEVRITLDIEADLTE